MKEVIIDIQRKGFHNEVYKHFSTMINDLPIGKDHFSRYVIIGISLLIILASLIFIFKKVPDINPSKNTKVTVDPYRNAANPSIQPR